MAKGCWPLGIERIHRIEFWTIIKVKKVYGKRNSLDDPIEQSPIMIKPAKPAILGLFYPSLALRARELLKQACWQPRE